MLKEFARRYVPRRDAALTHIRAGNLNVRYDQSKDKHRVELSVFRSWGESLPMPFTFPNEFPLPLPETKAAASAPRAKGESSARNENANLRIIAAMLALLRDKDGARFPSDAKVIDVLVEKYGEADGISKRNLETVFAAAKRSAGDNLEPKTTRAATSRTCGERHRNCGAQRRKCHKNRVGFLTGTDHV